MLCCAALCCAVLCSTAEFSTAAEFHAAIQLFVVQVKTLDSSFCNVINTVHDCLQG